MPDPARYTLQVAGTYRPRFRLDSRVIRVPVIPGCDPRTACAAPPSTASSLHACMPCSVQAVSLIGLARVPDPYCKARTEEVGSAKLAVHTPCHFCVYVHVFDVESFPGAACG